MLGTRRCGEGEVGGNSGQNEAYERRRRQCLTNCAPYTVGACRPVFPQQSGGAVARLDGARAWTSEAPRVDFAVGDRNTPHSAHRV